MIRVLQLVDSLEVGGTERVAVNLANALSNKIDKSLLCTTRKEGLLKASLNKRVEYLFLDKKHTLDFKAIKRLWSFIKLQKVGIIHAHSSSFFLAILLKMIYPKVKIVWHDHYGNSEFLDNRKSSVLRLTSVLFSHVLSVNERLRDWARARLRCENVDYFPNFASLVKKEGNTQLLGERGKRIIHLANLRPQKDHETLFKAFSDVIKTYPDWSLHCIGKDFEDEYSEKIKAIVDELKLFQNVFFYGGKQDVSHVLKQCEISVLSSKSEGLPIALLEYGFSRLPAVVTDVGDCNKVVSSKEEGLLVAKQDPLALKEALIEYISNKDLRESAGNNLFLKVNESFSEKKLIDKLTAIYKLHL